MLPSSGRQRKEPTLGDKKEILLSAISPCCRARKEPLKRIVLKLTLVKLWRKSGTSHPFFLQRMDRRSLAAYRKGPISKALTALWPGGPAAAWTAAQSKRAGLPNFTWPLCGNSSTKDNKGTEKVNNEEGGGVSGLSLALQPLGNNWHLEECLFPWPCSSFWEGSPWGHLPKGRASSSLWGNPLQASPHAGGGGGNSSTPPTAREGCCPGDAEAALNQAKRPALEGLGCPRLPG